MTESIWLWIGFNVFVLAMLALDLGVFHRKTHVVSIKESLTWTAVWVTLALVFNGGIWHFSGSQKALEFFTGYLIEKSLSVDNVFVFALLFSYFAVPAKYQHKVLFWGILGALIMRAIMFVAGAACRAQCEKRGRQSPPQVWPERLAATAQDASRREAKAVVENLKGDSDQL